MLKDKLTDLLKLRRKKQVDLAIHFNMSKASFNNKIRSCDTRFNLSDLIKLAELTNTKLCFADKETDKIIIEFDKEDIFTKEKEN